MQRLLSQRALFKHATGAYGRPCGKVVYWFTTLCFLTSAYSKKLVFFFFFKQTKPACLGFCCWWVLEGCTKNKVRDCSRTKAYLIKWLT